MNKNLFHLFFICLMISFAAEPASAQKYLKNLGKGLKNIPSTVTKATKATTATTATTAASARWAALESKVAGAVARSHPKLYTNVQIVTGTPKITALRNTLEAGYEPHRYNPRPALQADKALAVQDFSAVMPAGTEAETPVIPFQNQRGLIYRGLALNANGKAIRNILENGLRVQDVGKESNTFITSMAGPAARVAAVRAPVTNLTDKATDAVMWAGKRLNDGSITVVVVVKSPRKGTIITLAEDIPTSDIYAVTALLDINGTLTWCKVELEGEGFRITPYGPPAE